MKNRIWLITVLTVLCLSFGKVPTKYHNPTLKKSISYEPVFSTTPMAAVEIPGHGIYLFRGTEYYKYEMINNERVLLAGYPKKLPGGWQGLPDSFLSGIDAAVYHPPSETTFFFKGNQYVRLKGIKVLEDFPKKLPGGWQSLPSEFAKDIDAAMYYPGEDGTEGHIILVKGNKYVSFKNFKLQVLNGNVKDLWKANLPAPFNVKIDAMLENPVGTFLISGNNYITALGNKLTETSDGLNFARRSQVAFGGTNSMSDWQVKLYNLGPPDYSKISADAGVYIPDMGTYIFADDKYYKYTPDLSGKKEPELANGYPLALPGNWQGLPKEFHADIDAAFHIGNEKTYLIKGNQYLRITGRKVDDGYPRTFPGNWEGLPKSFYSDIDAAFTVGGEGKTYVILVKNKSFVAFHNWKKVASGTTKDLFKGLPKGYDKDIQAAIGLLVGQTLFSGDQSMVALHGYATEGASFSLKELPLVEHFYEARPVDLWKLPVRNRPFKNSASGNNDGIDVAVLASWDKSKSNQEPPRIENKEEGDYHCIITHMDESKVSPDQVLLDPTTRVIWPGAIIDGKSIPTGEYNLLNYPRNNFKISISARNIEKSGATISEPLELDHVRDQVNSLINRVPKNNYPNEKLAFSRDETYSEKQFRLKFGGSYNAGIASVSAGLEIESKTNEHRLVIEFVQQIFSIDVNDVNYRSWIKEPTKIDFYNSMPMYVSSVKYGRRAYMSIESSESLESLKKYFNGSYYGSEINLSDDHKRILNKSKIKVYIAGSSAKDASSGGTGSYSDFMQYLKKAPQSAGDVYPIAYTMNFLKDNSIAKVSLSSKYTIRNCTTYQLNWKVTLKSMTCTGVEDPGDDEELYGIAWADFYDKNGKLLKTHKLWHTTVDNYVRLRAQGMPDQQTLTINNSKTFNYKMSDVKNSGGKADGAYIVVRGWIEEDDDGTNGNDDLGRKQIKVLLKDVIGGALPITLDGFAHGGSKAKMDWQIETY